MSTIEAETVTTGGAGEARGRVSVPREGPLTPAQAVEAFQRALRRGDEWYGALLDVIARWVAPAEAVEGITHRYLLAGEAFDWLLLAQRLIGAAGALVPEDEAERLLVHGISPRAESEEEFEAAIGAAKYRAHLNFQYGVIVEELLLLAAEMELAKAGRLVGAGGPVADVLAYEHVYGKTLDELKTAYATETNEVIGDRVTQSQMQAFTYWLSKYRVLTAEPARVASDTRKAMAMLSRMEGGRARIASLRDPRPSRPVIEAGTRHGASRVAPRAGRVTTARQNQAPAKRHPAPQA